MVAKDLISNEIAPLRTSDTGEQVLTMMNIYHVKHLPIVNEDQFLGLISEDIILNHDMTEPIGSYSLGLARPFVEENDHIFEVISKIADLKLTVIPVVDADQNYMGLVSQEDLLRFYASSFSFSEPGSIIVIATTKPNYSLAEISQIIESENAAVLASFLTVKPDSTAILVTIKINKQDINTIIAAFERYDYSIEGTFSEYEYYDDLKDRYDALMSYLNV